MNKKLELDMSEFLIASDADNVDRMERILNRLDLPNKERMARALLKGLYPTLYTLPGATVLGLKREFRFNIDKDVKEEVE